MKTPEEMAEEAINDRWKISDMPTSREGYVNTLLIRIGGYKDGFLDGYNAAQDQLADTSKVMPDHNADASKKVDEVSALLDENELVDMKLKRQYDKAYLDLVLSTPGCNPLTSFGVPPHKHDVNIIGEYVEHLEDVIAARSSKGILHNWISVKDRLPERRKGVLFLHRSYGHNIGFYDSECRKPGYEWFSMEWTDVPTAGVTHWMPLPSSPEDEK